MESLKGMFHRLKPDAQAVSQTPPDTKPECHVCGGATWLVLPGKDHEGFPRWRACHGCSRWNFLRGLGFAENERIEDLGTFDVNRQPERKAREAAALASQKVREWIAGDLASLVLCGPIGVGKTHLAKAAVYELGLRNARPAYVSGPDFERQVKNFDISNDVRERHMAHLIEAPRLAFDDIGFGGKDGSPWMRSQLEALFDGRYRRDLGSLLTTNLLRDELASYAGVRVVDRIMQDGAWITMPGESQREES